MRFGWVVRFGRVVSVSQVAATTNVAPTSMLHIAGLTSRNETRARPTLSSSSESSHNHTRIRKSNRLESQNRHIDAKSKILACWGGLVEPSGKC